MITVEAIDITPIQQIAEVLWNERKEDSISQSTEGLETFSQKITGKLRRVLGRKFPTNFNSGRWPRIDENFGQVWLTYAVEEDSKKPDSFINTSTIHWTYNNKPWSVAAEHEGAYQIGSLRKVKVTSQNQTVSFIPVEEVQAKSPQN